MEPTTPNVVEGQLEGMVTCIEQHGETDEIQFGPFVSFSGIEGAWVGPIVLDPDMVH